MSAPESALPGGALREAFGDPAEDGVSHTTGPGRLGGAVREFSGVEAKTSGDRGQDGTEGSSGCRGTLSGTAGNGGERAADRARPG